LIVILVITITITIVFDVGDYFFGVLTDGLGRITHTVTDRGGDVFGGMADGLGGLFECGSCGQQASACYTRQHGAY
jgi:hypothetical protein